MKKKISYMLYRIVLFLVRVFSPKMQVEGIENLPGEPCIIAGNHCQMYGPIACEIYFPGDRYTWCAGEMMKLQEVPAYAFRDFWSQKSRYTRWFFKLASYVIAPLSVLVFGNAKTIPVYRDARIMTTFRTTMEKLAQGAHAVIFPECGETYNHIVYRFQEGFVNVARLYYRKTGKALCFVPMYIAPRLKKMVLGAPIRYNPENAFDQESRRICAYLMQEITRIATGLPRHTVVPYRNIRKRDYPTNI